jgi:hypothetical protein
LTVLETVKSPNAHLAAAPSGDFTVLGTVKSPILIFSASFGEFTSCRRRREGIEPGFGQGEQSEVGDGEVPEIREGAEPEVGDPEDPSGRLGESRRELPHLFAKNPDSHLQNAPTPVPERVTSFLGHFFGRVLVGRLLRRWPTGSP